jgi:hypothetical protein
LLVITMTGDLSRAPNLDTGGSMDNSVIVRLTDLSTGATVVSADVRVYPIGTPGERCALNRQDGEYSFNDLPEGDYSLAVYSPYHVAFYERFTQTSEVRNVMSVQLSPAGFLTGRILDERGQPPERCWFTLIREGEGRGRSGYVSDSGDHEVSDDGEFHSPPLKAGRYFIRVAGFLRKPASISTGEHRDSPLDRYFDFLYPNADVLAGAEGFDVGAGETRSGLQLQIPHIIRYTVRGKVIGDLPGDRAKTSVMFRREFGTIDDIGGGGGVPVQADGSFEDEKHPGIYTAEIMEFSAPNEDGRVKLVRRLGEVKLDLTQGDLDGVEIYVSADGEK